MDNKDACSVLIAEQKEGKNENEIKIDDEIKQNTKARISNLCEEVKKRISAICESIDTLQDEVTKKNLSTYEIRELFEKKNDLKYASKKLTSTAKIINEQFRLYDLNELFAIDTNLKLLNNLIRAYRLMIETNTEKLIEHVKNNNTEGIKYRAPIIDTLLLCVCEAINKCISNTKSKFIQELGRVDLTRKKLEEIKRKYNLYRKFVHTGTYSGLLIKKGNLYIIGMYNIGGAGGGLVFKDRNTFLEVLLTYFKEECNRGEVDLSKI